MPIMAFRLWQYLAKWSHLWLNWFHIVCTHLKSGFPGCPESTNYFDFPQSYSLYSFSVFLSFSLSFSIFLFFSLVFSFTSLFFLFYFSVFLCFCCWDLRTFSAKYFGLGSRLRKLFRFLDVCLYVCMYTVQCTPFTFENIFWTQVVTPLPGN